MTWLLVLMVPFGALAYVGAQLRGSIHSGHERSRTLAVWILTAAAALAALTVVAPPVPRPRLTLYPLAFWVGVLLAFSWQRRRRDG
jgi:hypothetical protein